MATIKLLQVLDAEKTLEEVERDHPNNFTKQFVIDSMKDYIEWLEQQSGRQEDELRETVCDQIYEGLHR